MSETTTVDMTKGVYRRVFSGYLIGRRINACSWIGEAIFWRLHMLADDFGNLSADPELLPTTLGGRRGITRQRCENALKELSDNGLIKFYQVGRDRYIHIFDFERKQKSPNGRPIRRVPAETGGNQMNPVESCCSDTKPKPIRDQAKPSAVAHAESETGNGLAGATPNGHGSNHKPPESLAGRVYRLLREASVGEPSSREIADNWRGKVSTVQRIIADAQRDEKRGQVTSAGGAIVQNLRKEIECQA